MRCPHNFLNRSHCPDCSPHLLCEHKEFRRNCSTCRPHLFILRICELTKCSKKFKAKKIEVRRGRGRYCSRRCATKGKTKIGKTYIDSEGYVRVCTLKGWKLEHRVVMAQKLGRPLKRRETVHHKNGVRSNNHPDNLELWSKSHSSGQRVLDRISDARAFLEEYGYTISGGALEAEMGI